MVLVHNADHQIQNYRPTLKLNVPHERDPWNLVAFPPILSLNRQSSQRQYRLIILMTQRKERNLGEEIFKKVIFVNYSLIMFQNLSIRLS